MKVENLELRVDGNEISDNRKLSAPYTFFDYKLNKFYEFFKFTTKTIEKIKLKICALCEICAKVKN